MVRTEHLAKLEGHLHHQGGAPSSARWMGCVTTLKESPGGNVKPQTRHRSKVGSATVPIAQVGKLSFGETQWPNLEIALITTTLHVCSLHGYFIIAKLCYSF